MRQEKKRIESVPVEESVYKRVLKCGEEQVLTLTLRLPRLPEGGRARRRILRYYQRLGEAWRTRWEGPFFAAACAALGEARDASRPFRPWEAAVDYIVTYNQDGLLSLYLDAYEYTGGAHGVTSRTADTWDLHTGFPRLLPSFFPAGTRWRQAALSAVRSEVNARLSSGESVFFDDWETAAVSHLDPARFYLSAQGPVLFYPLYTLAPYVEGIPAFPISVGK